MTTEVYPKDEPLAALELKAEHIKVLRGDFLAKTKMTKERQLGTGLSGEVILASYLEKPQEKLAVKIFSRSSKMSDVMFVTEVAILQKVRHPNILTNVEAFQSPDSFILTMPYYPRGSLRHHLQGMTNERSIKHFLQLASALLHLHANQLVHRDVKPDNVLLDGDDVILIDFGVALQVKPGKAPAKIAGTKGYLPPEVYTHKIFDLYKCDVYALGVVLWNLVFQTIVPADTDLLQHVDQTKELPRVFTIFLKNLLRPDPVLRWSDQTLVEAVYKWPEMSHMISYPWGPMA